jgi:hypothetical protein
MWVVNATPRMLYPPPPRERDPVPILQKGGRAAGAIWTGAENFAAYRDSISDCPARWVWLSRIYPLAPPPPRRKQPGGVILFGYRLLLFLIPSNPPYVVMLFIRSLVTSRALFYDVFQRRYRVIHNSLTHCIKPVHLGGRKDCNMRPAEGRRNFFFAYLVRAVCPSFVTRQTSNR